MPLALDNTRYEEGPTVRVFKDAGFAYGNQGMVSRREGVIVKEKRQKRKRLC
jgi:hypothetical protein